MGLLSRFHALVGEVRNRLGANSVAEASVADAIRYLEETQKYSGAIRVSGTTTFAREDAARVASRSVGRTPGYAELQAWVERDGRNPEFPSTCYVLVGENELVGALFQGLSASMPMRPGLRVPVRLQIFTAQVQGQTRVDAWIWAGSDAPQWRYSRESPPPITTQQRAQEAHEARKSLVRDALMEGGSRGAAIRAGMKRGVHYLELIEPIKQLKRENRLEEALTLAYQAIQAAENEARREAKKGGGREPPPWYTLQAAIIHRKLKQRDAEIAVLERWMKAAPPDRRSGSQVEIRLDKLIGGDKQAQ